MDRLTRETVCLSEQALFEDRHLMADTVPFAERQGAGFEFPPH